MEKIRTSLSTKLLWGCIILLFPALITFIIGYRSSKTHLENLVLDDLTVIAEAYEGQVYQFMEMSRRRATDFSSDGYIRDQLQKIAQGNKNEVEALNRHLIYNKLSLDKTINSIHIISSDGRVAASTNSKAIGMDVSGEPFFLKGKEGIAVTESITQPIRLPSLAISIPLTDRVNGKVLGVLVNTVLLTELDRVLAGEFNKETSVVPWGKRWRKPMDVYLINKDKLMIAGSRLSKGSVLSRTIDTSAVNECLQSNNESAGIYTNYQGMDVAGASMCIPSMKWALMVEIARDEVLSPVMMMRRHALIVGIIIIGLIGMFIAFFYVRVIRPIEKVSATAEAITNGNFKRRMDIRTGDEIEKLAGSINKMALGIEGAITNLEGIVEERTTELAAANEELKSLDRLKADFLRAISHELRSPLSPILVYLELMRDGGVGDMTSKQQEIVAEMHTCGKQMQLLIDELLEVASIEAGAILHDFKEIDLCPILIQAIKEVREYAGEVSTEIVARMPEEAVLLAGDSKALSGIFTHLLRNAVKFSQKGRKVKIDVFPSDKGVEVAISDNGIGIPKDKLDKIFDAFYQVDSSMARRYEGVGLGLYLVKKLIDLHKGSIRVESKEGKGTVVYVFIPKGLNSGTGFQPVKTGKMPVPPSTEVKYG